MTERLQSGLTPERIVAFVDGELPAAEQREVAAAIAADPAAQAMATAMRRSAAAIAPTWRLSAGQPSSFTRPCASSASSAQTMAGCPAACSASAWRSTCCA